MEDDEEDLYQIAGGYKCGCPTDGPGEGIMLVGDARVECQPGHSAYKQCSGVHNVRGEVKHFGLVDRRIFENVLDVQKVSTRA